VIVGALIGIAGQSHYIRETLAGRSQPNRVTFLMWTLAPSGRPSSTRRRHGA
jgi:hypothetical protein